MKRSRRRLRQRQIPEAKRVYEAYLKKHAALDMHFRVIAETIADERAAEEARRVLVDAGLMPAPFPRGADGRALRLSVVVPGYVSPPARPPSPNDAYAR